MYDTANSTAHQATWWLWYDGVGLGQRQVTDANTDRMSFYLKTTGMKDMPKDNRHDAIRTNFHVGTYLCWSGVGQVDYPGSGTGKGCPYEGPGNQHYYHYLSIESGAWIHVLLDQHPQHRRGTDVVGDNPSYILSQKNYFEHMNQFYMEIRYAQPNATSMSVDEVEFYSTQDTAEPDQNNQSITSLWVGYWSQQNQWRIGFQDNSFTDEGLDDYTNSTYEVRWSTSPITNENYANATPIDFDLYAGSQYTGQSAKTSFRRANSWRRDAFNTFTIPADQLNGFDVIYFAVKDISVSGQHVGTRWPWNRGDGHNSPSPYIKVIDYHLVPVTEGPPEKAAPNPPSYLGVQIAD